MRIKELMNAVKKRDDAAALGSGQQKFLNFCCSCVKVILAIVLGILTVSSMLVTCSVDLQEWIHYSPDKIYLHILFAGMIAFLLIVCRHVRNSLRGSWLERVFRDFTQRMDFCKVVVIAHFVLGIFWVVSTQVIPQVDQLFCAEIAERQMFSDYDFADYKVGGYAYNYPYQSGLILTLSIVFRLFGGQNFIAFQICNVFAMLLFDIALLKITEYIESPAAKKVAAVLIFIFWPLVFYTVFIYGNLMGLAFAVAAVCFEYRYFRKRRLRDIVISSVFIGLAVMMKSNYLIFLVAMLIFLVLDFIASRRKRTILFAVLAVGCYLIGTKGPITYMTIRGNLDIEGGVPMIAFVSMGLRESELAPGWWSGYYNESLYTENDYNQDLASAQAIEDIRARLSDFASDPGYTADFFYKKMISQWCEPTFEGIWINHYEKGVTISGIVDNILNRNLKSVVEDFLNLYQTFIYWPALLFVILNRKNNNIFLWLPGTAVIGGFLFHMVWEAKGQYTMPYFVMLIPYALITAVQVSKWGDDRICPMLRGKRDV
ncbi:MAG TPA: glycosyltransferase family 39 protein [Candidatus Mediterraneibacter norfolkensis]|nr:glycosyltransferase family 39 protein [Candidatus Mediterraneibacter norfolkensis]